MMMMANEQQQSMNEKLWFSDEGARAFQNLVRTYGWQEYVFDQEGQSAIVTAVRSNDPTDAAAVEREIQYSAEEMATERQRRLDAAFRNRSQRKMLNMPPRNLTTLQRPFLRDKGKRDVAAPLATSNVLPPAFVEQ